MHRKKRPTLLTEFLRDKAVASVAPTARKVVKKICDTMDLTGDRVIVEWGPGTGPFTKELLRRMSPHSHLIAIDTNENLVTSLKHIADPRLTVIHGDALDSRRFLEEHHHAHADIVLSGIPFSAMPPETRLIFTSCAYDLLREGGEMHVYQFRRSAEAAMRSVFGQVRRKQYLANLPPLLHMVARKTS